MGVIYSPPDRHPRRVGFSESDALMDSLSPGVRVKRLAGRSQTIRCSTAADGNAALEARIFGVVSFQARDAADSVARRAIALGFVVGNVVGAVMTILGMTGLAKSSD
jgi:hypothetical protein